MKEGVFVLKLKTIKAEMARNSITGLKLAELLNLSPTTLYLKLSGKRDFTANELGKLSEILKTDVNFFYN